MMKIRTVSGNLVNLLPSDATGQALTVKTAAGSGVAIANGKAAIVMSDGTNVIALAAESV